MKQHLLSDNWQIKKRDMARPLADDLAQTDGWLAATVPGTVQQALLAANVIPDPFFGLNENEVQWIGEADWLYRCTFDSSADMDSADYVALCCDGLDTFATAWLNGTQIFSSDTMFVPQRVQIQHLLRPGHNELVLLFESVLRRGKEREAEHGVRKSWSGDSSRVYVRKAQCHYGWDWGPKLLTAGPWRAVRLEAYDTRIAELHCPVEVSPDLQQAKLPVTIKLDAHENLSENITLHLALYAPTGELLDEVSKPVTERQTQHIFDVATPALWWPNGYGEHPLYRLVVRLQATMQEFDRYELRLGIRRLRLLQEPREDEQGTSFCFEVNNMPIFCGGANWIPADSFLPRLTPERYRSLLQLASDAHIVMLRVWGGGIYEEDVFYDLCDELGLLVWQDFMFACAMYPAHEQFQASIRMEAEANVRRLRHHPSIALWCGNNEDYMVAGSIGSYDSSFQGDFVDSSFPARAIYERLLPEVCAALDPTRPYWPGSPYGGMDANDTHLGDQHVWGVWHGTMANYHEYPRLGGSFVSEFGMQALPEMTTIESFTIPTERYPQSLTLEHHNKAADGPRRLAVYLSDTVRVPAHLEGYIYATQFVQSEALATAIRAWRRRWKGSGHDTVAGALVWQLDDCWPVTSWAIVDYAHRPKPAYYTIRRELAPLAVGMAYASPGQVEAWAINGTHKPLEAILELRTWTLDGLLVTEQHRPIILAPNQCTELEAFAFAQDVWQVLHARLWIDGAVVARAALWPEPFKYLTFPDPGIICTKLDEHTLQLQTARPVKGVLLSSDSGVNEIMWSDNMLDLFPDDPQVVGVDGPPDEVIHIRWLGQDW